MYIAYVVLPFLQICGSRKRRDVSEEKETNTASGNAVLTAGPIITRSGKVS